MKLSFKFLQIILATLIIASCSQYRKVTCPAYVDNFYTQKRGTEKHKGVKLRKSINSTYKSFYKTKNDQKKNQRAKNNHIRKTDNSAVTQVIDFHNTQSAKADFYASNDNSLSLKNSLVPGFKNPVPSSIGKSRIINKKLSRKEFKRDLRREIRRIKSGHVDPDTDPGVKLAKQSSLFGILSIGSYLLLFIPFAGYIVIPAIILFSVLAIVKGNTALGMLDKANYKSISKARTGKTLGIISLVLLGILLVLTFIVLLLILTWFKTITI